MKKTILALLITLLLSTTHAFALYPFFSDNPLFKAIDNKDTAKALDLIKKDPKLALKAEKDKITPLMAAAYRGNIEVAKVLLSLGASPTDVDDQKNNALMYSVESLFEENLEMVKLLIPLTPNINQSSSSATALFYAARNGHSRSVKLLVEAGAKINQTGANQLTPLNCAVTKNHEEVVKVLLQLGADVNARDSWSMTPLMNAAFENRGRLVRILLKSGACNSDMTNQDITVSSAQFYWQVDPNAIVIPSGSTALDIATLLENRYAQYYLEKMAYY